MSKLNNIIIAIILICFCSCSSNKELKFSTNLSTKLYKSSLNILKFETNNKQFEVAISNGQITKIDDETYSILIDTSYTTTLLIKQGKKIQKKEFRVYDMPKPELRFWTKGNGNPNDMTLQEFKTLSGVAAIVSNFTNDCIFKITNIEIEVIENNGTKKKVELKDPTNSDFHRMALESKKGNVYLFKNIKIEIQDTKRSIEGKEFTMFLK